MQLILTPVKLAGTKKLAKRILSNEDILNSSKNGYIIWLERISNLINNVLWSIVDTTSEVYNTTASSNYSKPVNNKDAQFKAQVAKKQRPARTLSAFEQELMESMHQKVTQPLFQASLRILVSGSNSKEHMASLRSALDGYSVPLYQELKAKMCLPLIQRYRKSLANKRLPAITRRSSMILSTNEAASLYHFPSSRLSRTDNLITSLSKTLPAPVSLKSNLNGLSVIIGENQHHGIITPIGLTEAERARHLYIIGGTGNGKTTMLLYAIIQDIKSGKGLAVLDPHGDMAETILRHIPGSRIDDVIYMNPDDLSHPVGMNLLELPEGLTGDDLLREKDIITESVVSVMRKIFSEDDSGGHRIEYILRNTIQTALALEKATLFTIFQLLNDSKFRRDAIKKLDDKNLKDFWNNEIGKAGEMQKVKMAAGITAKIGRFLFSASARRVLEQEKSTIDFDNIINEGKILICNFSKGLLGEDTSALFGTTVLAKLQLASLRRARIQAVDRRPFYLYVDEFQNFATTGFTQMLSEARKYKLFLTMAEQSTSQQDQQKLVDVILANVGTVVCFRSGSPADERLVLPLFSPYVQEGEIANLPTYSFYARIAAVRSQEPMSGVTLLLEDEGDADIAKQVIKRSREKYSIKVDTTKPVEVKPDVAIIPESVQKIVKHRKTITSQPSKQNNSTSSEAKPLG
jgi:DNA helicase HerA-like ATPase